MININKKLSEAFNADDSEIANFERLVAQFRSQELSDFVLETANLLQSNGSFVVVESQRVQRVTNSYRRERAILYLEELILLWQNGTVCFDDHVYQKARYALLRGYIGRLEELDAIKLWDHRTLHLPYYLLEAGDAGKIEKVTKRAVCELMQKMHITESFDY